MMSVAVIDESLGDLDEAVKGYGKLADAYRDTFMGKAAAERVKKLQDEDYRKQVAGLQKKLGELAELPPPLPPDNTTEKKP
jgi:hypothetical protein